MKTNNLEFTEWFVAFLTDATETPEIYRTYFDSNYSPEEAVLEEYYLD